MKKMQDSPKHFISQNYMMIEIESALLLVWMYYTIFTQIIIRIRLEYTILSVLKLIIVIKLLAIEKLVTGLFLCESEIDKVL